MKKTWVVFGLGLLFFQFSWAGGGGSGSTPSPTLTFECWNTLNCSWDKKIPDGAKSLSTPYNASIKFDHVLVDNQAIYCAYKLDSGEVTGIYWYPRPAGYTCTANGRITTCKH